MTILESDYPFARPQGRPGLFSAVFRAIERNRLAHARQQATIQLTNLDAHLLRDLGIEPADVAEALNRRSLSPLFYPIRPSDSR